MRHAKGNLLAASTSVPGGQAAVADRRTPVVRERQAAIKAIAELETEFEQEAGKLQSAVTKAWRSVEAARRKLSDAESSNAQAEAALRNAAIQHERRTEEYKATLRASCDPQIAGFGEAMRREFDRTRLLPIREIRTPGTTNVLGEAIPGKTRTNLNATRARLRAVAAAVDTAEKLRLVAENSVGDQLERLRKQLPSLDVFE